MTLDDDRAADILEQFVDPVLDMDLPATVLEIALWMELEGRLGPEVHDAFDIEIDVDEKRLSFAIVDRILAEKLLKRYLPIGLA